MKQIPHEKLIWAILLGVGTMMLFMPMLTHDFLIIDDHVYVTDNNYVKNGLSIEGVKWAFTTLHAEFYHPITWLSLMLDTHLFGVQASGYLFTNLLLHILNTLLLYKILEKTTRRTFRSALVAMLFAWHPLHIESVAWIAERKDVLSTFFWMLTIWSYIAYFNKPHNKRYIGLHIVYLMGLLSKPMLVTLPIILLILDYWPLGRYHSRDPETRGGLRMLCWLIREKLGLFFLSGAAGVLTIIAQYKGGGLDVMQDISLWERVSNASLSIFVYIFRFIWPQNLAVYYPFPLEIPWLHMLVSLFLMVGITVLSRRLRGSHPYFWVGWLWYIVTLLPVLGILKVGGFATADRYTYIPLIGLFVIFSWGISDLMKDVNYRKAWSLGLTGVITPILFLTTSAQLVHWTDSLTLFTHAAKVTTDNDFAHHSLGHIYAAKGDLKSAVVHFQKAYQINPHRNLNQKDLARLLAYQGKFEQSGTHLRHLLETNPDYGAAHYVYALLLSMQKRYAEALSHLTRAFRLHPQYQATQQSPYSASEIDRLYRQGQQDFTAGHIDKAKKAYIQVLEHDSLFHPARLGLARIMVSERCHICALELFLHQLSDAYLKQLVAAGYRKWPVFSDAKKDTI